MADEPCLVKTKDWWSYEVCYKKIAKQYHMEGEFLFANPQCLYQNILSIRKDLGKTKHILHGHVFPYSMGILT